MRSALAAALLCACTTGSSAASIRIEVFSLFQPAELVVRPLSSGLRIAFGDQPGFVFRDGLRPLRLELDESRIRVDSETSAPSVRIDANEFQLAVPGKISRRFRGSLEVTVAGDRLSAFVTASEDFALAAIVASEAEEGWPRAALEAQAIVSRSYLRAGSRHGSSDFCDTTHCQYLSDLPARGSEVWAAVEATAERVLEYRGSVVRAMFHRKCGGMTKTLEQVSLPVRRYPYFSVACPPCRRQRTGWRRRYSLEALAEILENPGAEAARLRFVRRRGWAALPSNEYRLKRLDTQVLVEGRGEGHGLGLCQSGTRSLAEQGARLEELLSRYFPATRVVR